MKALVARKYGTPDTFGIEELPIPDPGPGQLQVRIGAASLNPADLLMSEGTVRDLVPLDFPCVLGTDFAGTVTKLGPEVAGFAVGEEVFGFGAPPSFAAGVGIPAVTSGAMAEYALFHAGAYIARRPQGLSVEHAAALPSTGMTGLAVMAAGGFQPGETVLVIGAGGGIGSVVVPLLAGEKLEVIATTAPADEGYVRGLGAAGVIDYLATDVVEETLRRHPEGVDAVVNLALEGEAVVRAAKAIRPAGRLLSTTPGTPEPSAFAREDLTVTVVMGTTAARPDTFSTIAALAVAGTLPDPISRRYRLEDAVQAYRDLATAHTRGKLVVSMDLR
ncbi:MULTISPECIES: NADP-dependent oxidoreductase [unclassified Streptosporangium]|uniref:NADP-dependent oxidoreductase n=1 Tax=unclassified Streptosporangium TaxID=2632669 RepID=UPI002E28F2FC|nr:MULTISPECIES: NADP-dependent oxidoreductase [unclassified Streptosporangium]